MADAVTTFENEIAKAMSVREKAKPQEQGQPNLDKGLVANHVEQVGRILDTLDAQATQLEAEIADKTDKLRQMRVSIEAFRLAHQRLRP